MSIYRRTLVRAAVVAGAVALSTAGASSAFAAQSNAHPNGYAPTEECLNWTGTVQAYPALAKTAHNVTEVVSGTLSNCSFDGTPQTLQRYVLRRPDRLRQQQGGDAQWQRRHQLAAGRRSEPDHLAGHRLRLVERLLALRHDQQRRRHGRAARGQLRRRVAHDGQRQHDAEPRQLGPVRHLRQRRLSITLAIPPLKPPEPRRQRRRRGSAAPGRRIHTAEKQRRFRLSRLKRAPPHLPSPKMRGKMRVACLVGTRVPAHDARDDR